MGLATALRIPTVQGTGTPHMIEPQPPCASNPQFVAPELLKNEAFDGYAVDLWAAGVMLYTMLLGSEALFVAPVIEDRKFKQICVDGGLRKLYQKRLPVEKTTISDEAIELLQGMLRADPMARMCLSDVQKHPWVTDGGDSGKPPAVPYQSGVPES